MIFLKHYSLKVGLIFADPSQKTLSKNYSLMSMLRNLYTIIEFPKNSQNHHPQNQISNADCVKQHRAMPAANVKDLFHFHFIVP